MERYPVVLIVEDEPRYRKLIATNLRLTNYVPVEAGTGREALDLLAQTQCDLVLLDIRLPDIDGYEVCRRIRQQWTVPIIMVTALDTDAQMIQGLDFGADDYVVKPFRPETLLARIRAVLRRGSVAPVHLGCGDIALDAERREAIVRGVRKPLTPTEWRLLHLFVQECGRVLTHDYILARIWGPDYQGETEYLRVYVRRLRRLIEEDPSQPKRLVTRAGVGYVLVD